MISAGKHRGFGLFLFVSLSILAIVSLFRGAASFTVFPYFLLTGTSPKSCLGATSDLNEYFKKRQNFVDYRMPLQLLRIKIRIIKRRKFFENSTENICFWKTIDRRIFNEFIIKFPKMTVYLVAWTEFKGSHTAPRVSNVKI